MPRRCIAYTLACNSYKAYPLADPARAYKTAARVMITIPDINTHLLTDKVPALIFSKNNGWAAGCRVLDGVLATLARGSRNLAFDGRVGIVSVAGDAAFD